MMWHLDELALLEVVFKRKRIFVRLGKRLPTCIPGKQNSIVLREDAEENYTTFIPC